ncbi:MAG: Spy/CpxP family protein refolding chaperone [Acidobacteriia bacterium]|nr:Spy/CpxP family protein refolding chaperone [Terriglobia bacterium]
MTQNRLLTACAAAVLWTAFAFAQAPGAPLDPQTMVQMRVARLAVELNLTDAQKASVTTIYTNAYTAGQSLETSLQTNRQSLSDAIKKNDTAAIDQLCAANGVLTGQLTAIDSKAEAAVYAILTADQKTLYDSMPRGGPGGRGGRMGPMGFGPQGRRGAVQ